MTLEEFTNSKISSYKLELTDFKIIESNPNIMIDDNSAYKVTYTYTDNKDKKVQVMEVWTVINDDKDRDELEDHVGKAYSLRYEALPIEFPIYLNTANSTINSFEFQNIDDDNDDN
jgi:cell division protein FtsI/penicillin-binding protein 2